jgi:5-formyltetrahydrofolate cyclo-ligase
MTKDGESKKELRIRMRNLKKAFDKEVLKEWSEEITEKLEETNIFRLSSVIGCYHSLPDEVNTHTAIERWNLTKELYLPVVISDKDMEMVRYSADSLNESGTFGISEPILKGENRLSKKLDLLIVPGMAFDTDGNRLGRGKGYYDRFLSANDIPYIIGICYDFQLLDHIPTEPFDRRMNMIITEKRTILLH